MAALIAMREHRHDCLRTRRQDRLVRPYRTALLRALTCAVGVISIFACGSDTTAPGRTTNPDRVWALAFQWPAVNMALVAPYDTAHLIAIPRTVAGSVVPGSDSIVVQYSAPDSALVVSATGLVTARYPSSNARIVARVTANGVTFVDTAHVQVTTTPPSVLLASLSIQPHPDIPGTLKKPTMNLGEEYWVPFYAATTTPGDTVCDADGCRGDYQGLLIRYATSDRTVATMFPDGTVDANRMGRATLSISTLAYGIGLTDSLHVSVGSPRTTFVFDTVDNSKSPPVFYVRGDSTALAMPWSVGFALGVENHAPAQVELTLPSVSHGVYFGGKPTQLKDTLPPGQFAFVRIFFDSVGTYTIQHRLLSTGETFSQVYTIEPFP